MSRRDFLKYGPTVAVVLLARRSGAEGWPSKPVRLVLAGPPGGIIDVGARAVSDALAAQLGQPVVIDHRPGAGGLIAARLVAAAPADGYTLLLTVSEIAAAQFLTKASFKLTTDLTPVATIGEGTAIVCVARDLPIETLPDLVSFARTHPGQLNYLNPGNGTRQQLIPEQINVAFGVRMIAVPYRGLPPGIADLVEQRIQVGVVSTSLIRQHVTSGAVRAIAALGASRLPEFPAVPTLAEQGFAEIDMPSTLTLFGPRALPAAIVDRLNSAVAGAVGTPAVRAAFAASSIRAELVTPGDLAVRLAREQARVEGLIDRLGLKPE